MDARRFLFTLSLIVASGSLFVGCFDSAMVVDPISPPSEDEPDPPLWEAEPDPNVGPAVIAFVSVRDGSPHIYVATADGTGVRRLARGEAPSWSLDGRRIAFTRGQTERGPAGIYVMDASGEDLRYVGPGSYPAWSPDGRIVFNTSIWSGEGGISVMNADGTDPQVVLYNSFAVTSGHNPSPGYGTDAVMEPSWSPDGSQIAFRLYAGYMNPGLLYLINADGSNPRGAVEGTLRRWTDQSGGSWSPDGTKIASLGHYDIVMYDLASGTGARLEVDIPGPWSIRGQPDWSPDGRQLVFDAYDWPAVGSLPYGKPSRIFVLTLETGEVRQLIPEVTNPTLADYSDFDVVWARVAP